MNCKKCGKEIKEGNIFCTNCGKKISYKFKNKLHISFYIITILIIILVAFVCISIFCNKSKSKEPSTTNLNTNTTNTIENNEPEETNNDDAENATETDLLEEIKQIDTDKNNEIDKLENSDNNTDDKAEANTNNNSSSNSSNKSNNNINNNITNKDSENKDTEIYLFYDTWQNKSEEQLVNLCKEKGLVPKVNKTTIEVPYVDKRANTTVITDVNGNSFKKGDNVEINANYYKPIAWKPYIHIDTCKYRNTQQHSIESKDTATYDNCGQNPEAGKSRYIPKDLWS